MRIHSKTRLLAGALRVMDTMSCDRIPYETDVNGRTIVVLPDVFSPAYFTDTAFFALRLPRIVEQRSFLEIGVGTGAIALEVRLNMAKRVTGTDVNPTAVLNTKMNFRRYHRCISVREGDVFSPLRRDEKFDVIFWNHPYHNVPHKPQSLLQRSGLDRKYAGLEKYFRGAKAHLAPGGELLLGTSNIARLRDIYGLGEKYGYSRKLLVRERALFAHRSKQEIDLRIYSFKPL
ncbi:hypothetical protein A3C20_01525 [Candidatus Kaiserbacteria bacterium RIFCSPHIGHO2_02_FULL_55_25]|uniref:Methyltransferase small domain-containing protein n=1 Tax=Candidatus Kaiserbacteria bacterium RIFCSPHIGHO2_02_FULL_55_25 TaxID=1798498 RepID=A0A1F6E5N6_9BACT|nr:MAG: hypothetical protein A2764_00760 [Candidatus Kaiserbacteria bacterium RIFCSPHIGHO2_01_FULL_55_79]OGG69004.1 MAG: hypothetical protein A3C20_01525 [Candidatus Kaiserbacteria bacterium RIFCSPHIGHO2_02_FULL_55_25]OGG77356.1 MAG: hypothetical protein A3F56_03950 [Candidatus Kaiserbacteria bacterium RIFCSPHIGHO2_12_FULL_55_13]OGG82620.1 MAG: hypothetical protein A3A42_00775 [Candidatus Kaiserbacteria bacterium RIFCSPLOWO2_01_FULL_55_25]